MLPFGNLFGSGRTTPQEAPLDNQVQPQPEETTPAPVAQAPFRTNLKLTPERESEMIDRAQKRIAELRLEMGVDIMGSVEPGSWMDLRRRNEQSYQGDYSWRVAMGGIFDKSNFTLGSGIRHVRYMSARVQDDLVGTTPFFAAIGRNPSKADLAKQVEEELQKQIELSNVRSGVREAQKLALIRNECVVKTHWDVDASPFIGPATVLVDAQTGEPILTPSKSRYVFKDDDFLPHPQVQGLMLLEADPSFTATPGPKPDSLVLPAAAGEVARMGVFSPVDDLPQRLVSYEGVKTTNLDFRSFLCPLTKESVHAADMVVHLMRRTPSDLRAQYGAIDIGERYFSWWDAPGEMQPKLEQGEKDFFPSVVHQEVTIAEVYMKWDADGDNFDEEILLVLDVKNSKALFYNYLGNHMKKRPFEVIPGVEKIPNRWYGRGIYGILDDHFLFEDAEFNRANFKNSKNASMRFARKDAVDDWNNGIAPVVGDETIHWLNTQFDSKNPPIFDVNLYENVETDLELMNTNRQAGDSIIGAISVKDASQSDMNQSKTATGIVNLQQASDVITKATESEHTDAINKILEQVVDICLEHLDHTKLVLNKDGTQLSTLNREEIRSMDKDVRLLLTRSRSTQMLNISQQIIALGKDYWNLYMTQPRVAKALHAAYIAEAKSLEWNESEETFPEVTDEYIQQFEMQQAAQAQAAAAQQAQAPQKKAA